MAWAIHVHLERRRNFGDLYSKADLVRNDKGYIEMDANGALAKDANVEPIKLGSVLPKANLLSVTSSHTKVFLPASCFPAGWEVSFILPRKQLSTNTEYLKPVQKPATQVV